MKSYHEIIDILKKIIQDDVKLVHGGNIINWEETKIPELLDGLPISTNSEIAAGTQLKHKFTGQDYWVTFDDNKSITLSTMHNVVYYPKEIIWEHFERVEKGKNKTAKNQNK